MPVKAIDNYELDKYGPVFIKAFDEYRKALNPPPPPKPKKGKKGEKGKKGKKGKEDKKSKEAEKPKRKPHECELCLDDKQQVAYVKMIKQCQRVL